MAQVGEINVKISADSKGLNDGVDSSKRKLGELGDTAEKSEKKVSGGFEKMAKSAALFAAAYVSIDKAIEGVKLADKFNLLEARIRTATKATGDFATVYQGLFAASQTAGVGLETTASAFQNIAASAREIGRTNQDVIKFVDAFQKLGVIGGSSSVDISNAMRQTSQAIAGGVLRAEEFNSIVENTPEVARSIAAGMGKTVGELRQAVLAGTVLSEDVFDALLKQTNEINEKFKEMPNNLGKAGEQLVNSIGRALSMLDGGLNPSMMDFLNSYHKSIEQSLGLNTNLSEANTITGYIANGISLWSGAIDKATESNKELIKQHEKLVALQGSMTLTRGDIGLDLQGEFDKQQPKKTKEQEQEDEKRQKELEQMAEKNKLLAEEWQWIKDITEFEGQGVAEEQAAKQQEELTRMERVWRQKRIDDAKREKEERYKIASDMMGSLSSLMNSKNREMFEIGKVAATAQALINTYQGATKALAEGGFWGIAQAGVVIASGMAQVSAIQSTGFNSGAGGAGAGTTASAPAVGQGAVGQSRPEGGTLTVSGLSSSSLFTGDTVSALAEELLDYQRRGGNIVFQG